MIPRTTGVLALLLCLTACQTDSDTTPVLQLKPQPFLHQVQAEGELIAVNSTSINAPQAQGPRLIAEIQAEFTELQPGDLIVRFDARQLQRDERTAQHGIATIDSERMQQQSQQASELSSLALSQALVGQEFGFADRFSIDDVQIRSRLEILDSLQNRDYLEEKKQFLTWQQDSFTSKSAGEQELLQLRLNQQQTLLDTAQSGLNALEVRAPHAGILQLDSDWRGQKAEVGSMVFPGQRIGSLPDLSLQHLKLYVIEHEAAGLAVGQPVQFALAAHPATHFTGEVVRVGQVAQSRQRRDPRRYIEVEVAPDEQSPLFMPGSRILGEIQLASADALLLVPLQSLFSEENQLYVWKRKGKRFLRQPVEIGQKSLTHAEIVSGVQSGDRIALTEPEAAP